MVKPTATIGTQGQTVIPAALRERFGLAEGQEVVFEATPDGILIRSANAALVELYDDHRKAEFLLNNTVDAMDYHEALELVRSMGINPDDVPHIRPAGLPG